MYTAPEASATPSMGDHHVAGDAGKRAEVTRKQCIATQEYFLVCLMFILTFIERSAVSYTIRH